MIGRRTRRRSAGPVHVAVRVEQQLGEDARRARLAPLPVKPAAVLAGAMIAFLPPIVDPWLAR